MSEYLNRLGRSVPQEDARGIPLHVSDLSPTSELLLSPLHTTAKVQQRDTGRVPLEHRLNHLNFSQRSTAAQVNLTAQFSDHLKTSKPNPKEIQRKAFTHEVLYPKIHNPPVPRKKEQRTDLVRQYVNSQNSLQGLSHMFSSPTSSYGSRKPLSSPLQPMDKDWASSPSSSSDLKNDGLNRYRALNGDRYGSFVSPSSLTSVDNYGDVILRDYSKEKEYGKRTNHGSDANGLSYGDIGDIKINSAADKKVPLSTSILNDESQFSKLSVKTTVGSYGGIVMGGQRYNSDMWNGTSGGINPGIPTSRRALSGGHGLSSSCNDKSLDINNNYSYNSNGYTDSFSNGQLDNNHHLDVYGWNQENTSEVAKNELNSLDLFMGAALTTEDVLSQIFDRNIQNSPKSMSSSPSLKWDDHDLPGSGEMPVQHDMPRNSLVQTNVTNYYDKLSNSKNQGTFKETESAEGDGTTPLSRRGTRSKSSELPLRDNSRVNASYSLSKSWGSSHSRQEFQEIKTVEIPIGDHKQRQEEVSRSERVAKMFRIEEEMKLKRAEEFEEGKLLREVFAVWLARTRKLRNGANQLCRTHLMRKGMNGLICAVQCQKKVVDEFREQRNRIRLANCWEMWQQRTREIVRRKMQETFTQWHYYKLHEERAKLLETIANKHILAKNYSKWKARFDAKQKNSIASLHFKINLVFQCWQCWTLYTEQRRVKNHMNCVASYRYGERSQRRLFLEWRDRTQKSLLCRRLVRRRILLKAFFEWRHWTQYAKIVHLRLHNMCKEYHKRCLIKHAFIEWRQALRMKQAEEFWKNNQVRRTLKLWKLRYTRKRIHKYLCRALAKKAKKRRFFEIWTCFTKSQKETQSQFVKLMQNFDIRMLFRRWRNETIRGNNMRESLRIYEVGNKKRLVQHCWKSWKFEMKIMDLKKRCRNSWSLRSVRKSCEIWKLKVRKGKLATKLEQNRSIWKLLFMKRFFLKWMEEQDKARADLGRALYAASVLKKNYLGRVFQAWRVVNQEECIIEPLAKRRERKEMARVYDAWRHFLLRETHVKKLQHMRIEFLKRKTFGIWRHKLWSITKKQEIQQALHNSKLKRHFLAWMDYVKDLRLTERLREQKKANMVRKFVELWKQNVKRKVESREREKAEKANRRILLVSNFSVWKRKTKELTQRLALLTNMADTKHKQVLMIRSLKRWSRQYTIVIKTREYSQHKKQEQLKESFLAWRNFVKEDFEEKIGNFYSQLLDSSINSTSGYQTSMKNSLASFQFALGDGGEVVSPVHTPRSRPLTPIMFPDDDLDQARHTADQPSYRPVTSDRQSLPEYQTPPPSSESEPAQYRLPLTRQRSVDLNSQSGTSPQRSSEDDLGIASSGVHSAGEESDQEDHVSIHVTESVYSTQTTSEGTPHGRELLVADTIIHWRSLSASVAFRSWLKYTQHRKHIRILHAYWADRNREILLTKVLSKWRRWLFVTVLARQHWVIHLKKSCLFVWINYRQEQILKADHKDKAGIFSKKRLLKVFFIKWKNKKTTKGQLQNILGRWQKNAVFTNTDKVVIQQYQEKARMICLRQTFFYWKKTTKHFQEATRLCKTSLTRRCLGQWRNVACYRADLKKTLTTFRNSHILAKAFTEWCSRLEDNRTAKMLLGVSDERKVRKCFEVWQQWAFAASYRRKTSLAYHRSQEQKKLRTKFIFWLTVAKQLTAMKEHYHQSLQRRIVRSWKDVLTQKANTSGSMQDFQKIAQRNVLQMRFVFWKQRTEHNQLLACYLKEQAQRKLAAKFERWRNEKKKAEAKAHCLLGLKKKMFTCWRKEIVKRRKTRQHLKNWHTIAEATNHAQIARSHHSTKLTRRFLLEWQLYTRNRKRLSSSLEQFQTSHFKNDDGLLKKYMKIWKMKSSFSKQAENLYYSRMSTKYWKVWRHNYVRRKVSSAMVHHDNKKILSKVLMTWYNITASHNSLSKEVTNFRLQRLFRRWMARYNNS